MSIEFCPRCSARVRVPSAAEPESWVRCPRCRAESQLSELLSVEPPLLELLDGPSGEVPSYEPMLAGVGAAEDELAEFQVTASESLEVDEDSPTLPVGGLLLTDDVFDDEPPADGASIGRTISSGDDELFGFDDSTDAATLRPSSEDGKFVDVPSDGDEGFNLSPDAPADFGQPAAAAPGMGAGFLGVPTGKIRRKKKSGMVPMMIGVVFGGLFGIIIAYYGILMWAMGQDPFKLAKHFPENLQMLLPESLQTKATASKSDTPAVTPDPISDIDPMTDPMGNPSDPLMPTDPTMPPEQGNTPNNASANATANGEGETGPVPGLPTLGGGDTTPPAPKPMTDPLDPLALPENPPKPATDPLDPLAAATTPAKPATDPLDPLGNNPPVKPEMPKPDTTDPLDPLANATAPPKPEVTTPAPTDPLDPLATPVKPEMPAKPEVATPAPVDPLDPLAVPVKPEMPAKPEVTTPAPVDPLDPLAPKPTDPLDPLAPKPIDPLAVKPVDPLPAPVDPLATPAKPPQPLMLASASYAPEELQKSLVQVETAAAALTQAPDDRKQQAAVYRALAHVGEVAGQLKSLGETDETAQVNLDTIQSSAKKLADDPTITVITKLTSFWLSMPLERRNQGIVLHGKPGTSEAAGKLHKTSLEIPAPDPAQPAIKLSVVSEYPLLPGKEGNITLLGVIVENPAEQIPGYSGPAERVIWVSVGQMEKPAAAPAGEAKTPEAAAPAKTPSDDPFGDIK